MKNLSLKLKENIFEETEKITKRLKMPRNSYINKALEFYNKVSERAILKKKLWYESEIVADESMKVLHEFEAADDYLDDKEI